MQSYDINGGEPAIVEKILHEFFKTARIDLTIPAQGGYPATKAREWFLVPLSAISQAVQLINEGTISQYWYDRTKQTILKRTPKD